MLFNHKTVLSAIACASWIPHAAAENKLVSTSLAPCQSNNSFSASLFDVKFTPDNNVLALNIVGTSTVVGNVSIELAVYAYGYKAYHQIIDPCQEHLEGLCPMQAAPITVNTTRPLDAKDISKVPGIAYTVPDLDARVQVYFLAADSGASLACVEAELSNGQTVDQAAVGWTTAVIAGIGLAASAIASGLGHSNTASHIAANALALFGYFQSQALMGLTAVPLPPAAASWTQNFQWSMGIIRVAFIQNIATWYQRATGGTPSTVLSTLRQTSVIVQKRSLGHEVLKRALDALHNLTIRATTGAGGDTPVTILMGIQRVGFRAGIESTNIFLTGYIFYLIFVVFVVIGVLAFKGICELLTRMGHMRGDKFKDFRNGWNTVLKGILFRIILIGLPQMVVLCFWEFTRNDSGAEIVLAIFTVFSMLFILGWAASKVIRLARRSISMHKNPAYILYSDPVSLNKWGFLYVQFKASAYWFIVVALAYILIKGLFVALAQGSGTAQAIAFVIIEAAWLITICVLFPFMDKKTNAFNISIAAVNFVSAVLLLIFSGIFNAPGLVTGVAGVVFFILNAAFSTILLIMVLVASIIAVVAKNPDTRYQPMRDDRSSFIKSQTQLNTELDALGATARGEPKYGDHYATTKSGARIEDDDDSSWSGGENGQINHTAYNNGMYNDSQNKSMTQFSSTSLTGRHNPPYVDRNATASPYQDNYSRNGSMNSQSQQYRSGNGYNAHSQSTGPSPWQRGAGYD